MLGAMRRTEGAGGGIPMPRVRHVVEGHPIIRNFFGDRCPHLAAMVAYYALLSLFPLLFIALSIVGSLGEANEGSTLIRELERIVPGSSITSVVALVRSLQRNSTELGLIGLFGLLWSSLGFLSALESALNIVYDVPNRPFVRQKLVVFAFIGGGLAAVLVSLLVNTWAQTFLDRHAAQLIAVSELRFGLSLALSIAVTLGFVYVVYRQLPNTEVGARDALAGALVATALLQISFEALPLYLNVASAMPALKVFGGAALLLVWFYLMGNVLLLGAEITWWVGRGRPLARAAEAARAEAQAAVGA
jgi:membrane protein